MIFGLGVSTACYQNVLSASRLLWRIRTNFDRVLALPSQRLHQLARVAIVVGSIVADIVGGDGPLLVRQDLFGQVGGLIEGHFGCVDLDVCSKIRRGELYRPFWRGRPAAL